MRSPTTVGDPWPRPGTGAFQRMPSDSLHWLGGFCPEAAMPSRVGPRHAGQSELVIVEAAGAGKGRMEAQAMRVRIVLFFIRSGLSLANSGERGKRGQNQF